jgi:hypothetical protein
VDTLIYNGPSANRIDLTQMGDGWVTASDAPNMIPDLDSHIKTFFSIPEYHRYAKFFNVYRIEHFRSGPPNGTVFESRANADYYVNFINQRVPYTDVRFVVSREGAGHAKMLDGTNTGNWKDKIIAAPTLDADIVAEHLFGHAWHRVGDIYDDNTGDNNWINKTDDPNSKKWERWLGFVEPYNHWKVGVYPIKNTSSFRELPSTSSLMADVWAYKTMPIVHTPVERERVVHDFYALVDPLDTYTPNSVQLVNPPQIEVKTVDPEVIQVDWYVDEKLVAKDGGEILSPAKYSASLGQHTVRAHAFDRVINYTNSDRLRGKSDSLDWVRDSVSDLQQNVSWKVSITKVLSLKQINAQLELRLHAKTTTLEINVPGPGKYSIGLFNSRGEIVSNLGSGHATTNKIIVDWDARRFRNQMLFIRLSFEGRSAWYKWIGLAH